MWGRGPALYKHNYYIYTCSLPRMDDGVAQWAPIANAPLAEPNGPHQAWIAVPLTPNLPYPDKKSAQTHVSLMDLGTLTFIKYCSLYTAEGIPSLNIPLQVLTNF
jgi:hypothetical protein